MAGDCVAEMTIDKQALVRELRAAVAREIAVITLAARSAHAQATHEESRPENDKDTRALEASYLAGAQAERSRELEKVENALGFLTLRSFGEDDPIALTAIIELSIDSASQHYFISPVGGGMRVKVAGVDVQVVTPQSPVGQALLGRTAGDVVDVKVRQGRRQYEILAVQ